MRHGRSIGKRKVGKWRRRLSGGRGAVPRTMSPRDRRAIGIVGPVIALVHWHGLISESRRKERASILDDKAAGAAGCRGEIREPNTPI